MNVCIVFYFIRIITGRLILQKLPLKNINIFYPQKLLFLQNLAMIIGPAIVFHFLIDIYIGVHYDAIIKYEV